ATYPVHQIGASPPEMSLTSQSTSSQARAAPIGTRGNVPPPYSRNRVRWRFWIGVSLAVLGRVVASFALLARTITSPDLPSPAPSPTSSAATSPATSDLLPEQPYLNDAVDRLNYLIYYSESNNLLEWISPLTDIKDDLTAAQLAGEAAATNAPTESPSLSPAGSISSSGDSSGLSLVASLGTALVGAVTAIVGLMTALISWRQARS